MEEVEAEIGRKKAASRAVKALRAEIAANELEAAQLQADQQHLRRQAAGLLERIGRLDNQARPSRKNAPVRASNLLPTLKWISEGVYDGLAPYWSKIRDSPES